MLVHNKEYNFLLTVGASAEIAEYCPDGDMARIDELFEQPYAKQMRSVAKIVAALSRGYETAKKYEDPDYAGTPLTTDEILTLSPADYQALVAEALVAFRGSTEQTVETEPSKKKEMTA